MKIILNRTSGKKCVAELQLPTFHNQWCIRHHKIQSSILNKTWKGILWEWGHTKTTRIYSLPHPLTPFFTISHHSLWLNSQRMSEFPLWWVNEKCQSLCVYLRSSRPLKFRFLFSLSSELCYCLGGRKCDICQSQRSWQIWVMLMLNGAVWLAVIYMAMITFFW